MTAEIIDLETVKAERLAKAEHPILEALDQLALALVEHRHTWTDHERSAYEKAVAYLNG